MVRKADAVTRSGAGKGDLGDAPAVPAGPSEQELGELSFEQLLERLEGVVEALEEGDAPLEEALASFERGVLLSRLGAQRLDEAERRIEVLLRDGRTRPLREGAQSGNRGAERSADDTERTDDE